MNSKITTVDSTQFRNELINRFFNTKSYFYHCLKKELSEKKVVNNYNNEALSTLDKLITWLLNSKTPSQDLREISHIKGYKDFYKSFESKINEYDFGNLSREQVKQSIKNIAQFTVRSCADICSKTESRELLLSYLELKQGLRSLLINYNGSDKFINKKYIPRTKPNNYINEREFVQTDELPEEVSSIETEENLAFQKFFIDEINKTLSLLDEKNKEEFSSPENFHKCKNIFIKINELSKFHEYDEIEEVSEKLLDLIQLVEQRDKKLTQDEFNIIFKIKSSIQQYIVHQNNSSELNRLKLKVGKYVDQKKSRESTEHGTNKNEKVQDKNGYNEIQNIEYNTFSDEKNTNDSQKKKRSFSEKGDENLGTHEVLKKDMLQFTLPGEDDEDLMQLIQEISKTMSVPVKKDNDKKSERAENQSNKPVVDGSDFEQAENKNLQNKFYEEGAEYIQLILDAVKFIETNKNQKPALEEIETASFSLKNLAKKCDMENVSFLPELVESICINAYAAKLRFPQNLLNKIKQGALLLKKFDPENEKHETELISILSSLKEYYSYTLKSVEKLAIT